MSSSGIDKRAMCPFFIEEAGCGNLSPAMKTAREKVLKQRIRCEGLTPGGNIHVEFKSKAERDEHRENYCYTMCYNACPVAAMLWEQRAFEMELEELKQRKRQKNEHQH